VRQPIEEIGVLAARYVLAGSRAAVPAATILPTSLVVRDSA
jgi:DNA-binding LacI/PurR family transcriptional regulator